ncbi:MAG: MBL fold metallo-hydrolase [Acidimicrobiia bacterium]|nr:MBL fold metallo-hydrolase [Acidimicrobiia bacterium]
MTKGVVNLGDVTVSRLEESYGPGFPATMLMPSFDAGVREEFGPDTIAQFVVPETDQALLSIHTWVIRTPQKTILVDTCNGNHKQRNMPDMAMLNTDWLERLRASGVNPDEVDAVVCTHIHLDHVGWNTTLVNGEWVPTFPNARYYFNKTEYEFWNPSVTDQTGMEFNAYVFDDSIRPVFDRGLVELWDGDGHDVDDHFHLELRAGHTPGHAVGWLRGSGGTGLLSGDSMHSAVQVYRPDWNSGFCLDAEGAVATRRAILEAATERDAVLMPAHFSAPHAFKVQARGNGFAVVDAL